MADISLSRSHCVSTTTGPPPAPQPSALSFNAPSSPPAVIDTGNSLPDPSSFVSPIAPTLVLRAALINTWSLVKHATELADYIVLEDLDLLAVSETWLSDVSSHAAQLATPDGYSILRADRPGRKGGGVALIFKNHLKIHSISTSFIDSCQHLLLKISLNPHYSLSLFIIYRPPLPTPDFEEQLLSLLNDHIRASLPLLLLGDFNLWANDATDAAGLSLLQSLADHAFTQHVSGPTHREGNTLDWVLTRNLSISAPSVSPCPWSDHFFIKFNISLLTTSPPPETIRVLKTCRNLKNLTPDRVARFTQPLLDAGRSLSSTSALVDHYQLITSATINHLAPEKIKPLKTKSTLNWFSDNIISLRQKKRACERLWRANPSSDNRALYRSAALLYKQAIIEAKYDYYNIRVQEARSSSRELFTVLRELEGRHSPQADINKDDSWCQSIQSAFHSKLFKHQANIAKAQALFSLPLLPSDSLTPPTTTVPHSQAASSLPSNSFSFREVSEAEVLKIVSSMKPTFCKGDICPATIIQKHITTFCPLITRIVNSSFREGFIPPSIKESWISPLLKKESLDPADPNNYRPITTVPFILKILDRIAYLQIQAYLEESCYLGTRQSGFRAKHGTETALLDLKSNIAHLIDNGHTALLMLLDLSAAFDLVNHSLLLKRLEDVANFSPSAVLWISSFLDSRLARVYHENSAATPFPLSCGVPQGSCLSPTLYNVYTRPLFDILDRLGVVYTNYADDTQLLFQLSGNHADDSTLINYVYSAIQAWMASNHLALNDGKTELLILGSAPRLKKLSPLYSAFTISGCTLPVSPHVKTLGVHLDSCLSMKSYVNAIRSSCAYTNKLLRQIKPYLSSTNMSMLAGALVNSKLDYCNSLLAGTSASNLKALQVIQNGAVRAVCNIGRLDHVTSFRRALHWLPVKNRITFKTLSLTHKCLSNDAPPYLSSRLSILPATRALRSNNQRLLKIPRFKLKSAGGSTFDFLAPSLWNSLPLHLRLNLNLLNFKRHLKTFLFNVP